MATPSLAAYFAEINLLASLQFAPGEKPYIDRPSTVTEPKELLLYLGCNVLRTGHLAQTAIAVLHRMGFDFHAAGGPAHCCGIQHHNTGHPKARSVAANTIQHFDRYGAKQVLMWCPSCNEHFDDVVSHAQDVPFAYEHLTAFLARHLDRIPLLQRVEKKVALHYHTGSPQSECDWQHARAILQAIPGLELIDIPRSNIPGRHCSPKWIAQMGRDAWQQAVAANLDDARDASIDVVATIYHSCHREICHAEGHYPFSVVNYISLLGEAMGIDFPDLYKLRRLQADPDAALREIEPYARANGLDLDRVRDVLRKIFSPACTPDFTNPS